MRRCASCRRSCRPLPWEDADAVLPGEFSGAGRDRSVRAGCCAACSSARRAWASSRTRASSTSSSSSTRRRIRSAKRTIRDLKPIAPGCFGYSVIRNSVVERLLPHAARAPARRMDLPHRRPARGNRAGVIEAAIGVDGALRAADKAALFKTFTKVLAQRNDLMATFMAKWSQRLAGAERPHPPVAQGCRRQGRCSTTPASRTR